MNLIKFFEIDKKKAVAMATALIDLSLIKESL